MRALVFVLISIPAFADPAANLAREHYQKGTTLYELGKFHDAAVEYEEAYKAKSDPALLFNIGQAYRLAGDAKSAVTAYRSFLRKMPDAPNRHEVEAHIGKLQKQLDEQAAPPPTVTPKPPWPETPPPAIVQTAPPPKRTPVYKKWWLWTAVGGVVAAGLAVGLGVGLTQSPSGTPANTYDVHLH